MKIKIALAILLSQLFSINSAHASAVHFIDNGSYTTDTISGLDWLDVTTSVNQSYNYVSSQFGVGGDYEGWRYATGMEFNQMVSNYTGTNIPDTQYSTVLQAEGDIDQLHFLLGSTYDAWFININQPTFDAQQGVPEGESHDYTLGIIVDVYPLDTSFIYVALIEDDDIVPTNFDRTKAHAAIIRVDDTLERTGSYLVRDTLSAVPVPAAVWLMGTSLLGLIGYSRKLNSVAASILNPALHHRCQR